MKRLNVSIESVLIKLAISLRRDVVETLLAGNDTQCFTTQQYLDRYMKNEHEAAGPDYIPHTMSCETARMHLKNLPSLVYEIKPDVWISVAAFTTQA